jgi:hypothetical protein
MSSAERRENKPLGRSADRRASFAERAQRLQPRPRAGTPIGGRRPTARLTLAGRIAPV